jgi:hypothetical protein
MPNIFKRMRSLICDHGNNEDENKKPIAASSNTKLKYQQRRGKMSHPADFELMFPNTARNSSAIGVSLRRACGLDKNNSASGHIEKADYQAINDYIHVSSDEISLIKNDHLIFIRSNYIDFALVKNMRNNKIGFVPLSLVAEIEDLKEKE